MNHLSLAVDYAANGWPVFPCRPEYETVQDERGRDLIKKPKSPLTQYGFKDATITQRIIERWWGDRPEALIGVPTGALSGFWVLDIDIPGAEHDEDGRLWLDAMEKKHGALTTRVAATATGGRHFYFKHTDGVRNKAAIAPGVDTRGEGGYVCVPGSVLRDGTFYEWENEADIEDAPEWLLDIVTRRPPDIQEYRPQPQHDEKVSANEVGDLLKYIDPDCNYSDWVSVLMAIHSEFGSAGLAIAEEWSSRGKKYRRGEVERKWKRFSPGGGVGLGTLCALAQDGGADLSEIARAHRSSSFDTPVDNTTLSNIKNIINKAQSRVMEAGNDNQVSVQDRAQDQDGSAEHQVAAEQEEQPREAFFATPFKWVDPKTLPRREFAFGTHYIRKYVSVTVSPGGLGKTSNSIVEALSMASGKPLTGIKPPQRTKVWLFNAEDPRDEMERRIMAACLHYRLTPDDIEGYLFLDSGREQELIVMKEDRKAGVTMNVPIVEAVVANIERNGIDVMVVDPFVSTHAVNENDNGAIDKVAKLWAQIADQTNCAVDVVHHLRKVADREATVEDARGAVSLIGAARSVRVLNRMSEEQASAAGVDAADRFGYFSINYGKSNLSQLSHRLDWRRLESVPLGNGRGLSKPQDHAPVVTEWRWPSSEEVAGELTSEQIMHIRSLVDNGQYKESPRAKNWVGGAVAYALSLDLEEEANRRRATTIVKALMKEGTLVKVEEHDPIRREMGTFIRSSAA